MADKTKILPCGLCGEDCRDTDHVVVKRWFFFATSSGKSLKLCREQIDDNEVDDRLHRGCLPLFVEGNFLRLHSDAKFPGDDD